MFKPLSPVDFSISESKNLNMRNPPELFIVFISLSGLAFGVFALMLLRKLDQSPDTSSARIKLSPEKTAQDFRLLVSTDTLVAISLLIYGLAGALAFENLLRLAEWAMVLFSVPPVYAFFRLWRRI